VTPAFGYHPWFSHWISTEKSLAPVSDHAQETSEKERHYRNLFLPQGNSDPSVELEFSKLLSHLPDPSPLTVVVSTLRENLSTFPDAMLGEVGLDRAFRVPLDYFATPRILTSFRIPLEHQLEILEAQMDVALEMGRNISLHSVKSQLATLEVFERMRNKCGEDSWRKICIDLHSCGFSKQGWIDLEVGVEHLVFAYVMTAFSEKTRKCVHVTFHCD
jgi:Tat protein secretion system quality control protein TatD with DNase activity